MYEVELTVPPEGWSTAELFRELQTVSGDAVADSRLTGDELKIIGLMWVIIRYDIRMERSFRPGEKLRIVTWAGAFRHCMSQRNYLIYDEDGICILRGAGNWAIADRVRRCMVDASAYGLSFPAEVNGSELPRPSAPEKLPLIHAAGYTVEKTDLDMNQHMNNTRYFDIAESLISGQNSLFCLKSVQVAFQNEAVLGESLRVQWGNRDNRWYVCGEGNGKICFQMNLEYRPTT